MSAQASLRVSREQLALGTAGIAVSALCWAWSLRAAAHSSHGAAVWPLFAMWAVMMGGMMIPPELPDLLGRARGTEVLGGAALFLSGYLAPWIGFSLGAAALHAALFDAGVLHHGMALADRGAQAAVLAAAGISQLSPLKKDCLARCRSREAPASLGPSLRSGVTSGAVSVGSCGMLMLVLFVTGVMSVPAMCALTALLVIERVSPRWVPVSALAGVALLACAGWRVIA